MEPIDIFLATARDISYLIINHPIYSALGSVIVILALLRFYCRLTLGICDCDEQMDGKTVLITGATSGIGKETALELARRNARVLLACRNRDKALKVAKEIKLATGNEEVHVKILDLCSFKSVRKCVQEILETEKRLDVLINNAGITGMDEKSLRNQDIKTVDNNAIVMQSNHLGHFLLTGLLLDLLKKSAPSRIINVSSMAYTFASLDANKLTESKKQHPLLDYANSKLANLLFTQELAERLRNTGVTVNALHPGVVKTELLDSGKGFVSLNTKIVAFLFGKSAQEGAQTTIHLAVHPGLQKITGKYFADCKEESMNKRLVNRSLVKRLFDKSEEIVGITFPKA